MKLPPVGNFLLIKSGVVVAGGRLYGVVLRGKGLDDDPAAGRTPPRPARHLAQELESPLAGAEIRQVQAGIGADHAHQRHRGYVQSLGHHLRADEDIRLPTAEFP